MVWCNPKAFTAAAGSGFFWTDILDYASGRELMAVNHSTFNEAHGSGGSNHDVYKCSKSL